MSWYGTSYRKLFFDFHSRSTVVGLAKGFDAQRWAQRLQDAHVQAVSIFVKCGAGYLPPVTCCRFRIAEEINNSVRKYTCYDLAGRCQLSTNTVRIPNSGHNLPILSSSR